MPVKPLPANPNLVQLKYQARDLLRAHAAREPQVAQRIREFHPRFHSSTDASIFATQLRLSDAQLTIARERGFPSWARLKRHIERPTLADNLSLPHHERIEDPIFRRAVDLLDAGDVAKLSAHLSEHPSLVGQRVTFEGGNYFRKPTLLEFVAENPVRRGALPGNIVEVARVILEAGAKRDESALNAALGLVSSGCVPRQCRVQRPFIDLLCGYGADANSAILGALAHAEFDAVDALIHNGARMDAVVAAGLGRTDEFRRLLPTTNDEQRHRALALAAQFGHTKIVQMLLDAGVNPNRYNPVGMHAHSTPLHQAAAGGHDKTVRLLVDRGARVDAKDTMWQGTPADWARHEEKKEIEDYLRAQQRLAREKS